MSRETIDTSDLGASLPAGEASYTFDLYQNNTLAPRIAHHDKNEENYDDDLSARLARAIPLDAFGAVTSVAAQRYFPHNNGWGPLLVLVDPATHQAEVRTHSRPAKSSNEHDRHVITYDVTTKRVDYLRFWNGYAPYNHDLTYDDAIGNAVLFEIKSALGLEYLLVAGDAEISFVLPEGHPPIEYFSSKVDENDMPRPYAWSTEYVYCSMNYPGIEYTELKNVTKLVKSGDIGSVFFGNRDWKTGKKTFRLTEQDRASLVALPTQSLPVEIVQHPTPDDAADDHAEG